MADDKNRAVATRRFGLWSVAALLGLTLLFVAAAQLPVFGEGFHAVFAIALGVLGTIGIAVALMALTFHSARSGHDDEIEDP